jgi:hypothetical protein
MMLMRLALLMVVAGHGASAAAPADAQVCTVPGGCDAGEASNLMQTKEVSVKIRTLNAIHIYIYIHIYIHIIVT